MPSLDFNVKLYEQQTDFNTNIYEPQNFTVQTKLKLDCYCTQTVY